MTINADSLIAAIEELDEVRAKHLVLRDAVDHAYRIARKALLPQPDYPELCARVREVLDEARKLCDSLMTAAHRKGYEIADEEILHLAKDAGGWNFLSGEGQIRWLAARKRAAAKVQHDARTGTASDESQADGTRSAGPVGVPSTLSLVRARDAQTGD